MITEEERIWLDKLIHAEANGEEQPVLRWCLANANEVSIETDATNGELEWVIFGFGDPSHDYNWNPEDGWDLDPPILAILDALTKAEAELEENSFVLKLLQGQRDANDAGAAVLREALQCAPGAHVSLEERAKWNMEVRGPALATDAGVSLLARLKTAEEEHVAERGRAADRFCGMMEHGRQLEAERDRLRVERDGMREVCEMQLASYVQERDAVRAERDALLKTTESRLSAAERLAATVKGLIKSWASPSASKIEVCEQEVVDALLEYEKTREAKP